MPLCQHILHTVQFDARTGVAEYWESGASQAAVLGYDVYDETAKKAVRRARCALMQVGHLEELEAAMPGKTRRFRAYVSPFGKQDDEMISGHEADKMDARRGWPASSRF